MRSKLVQFQWSTSQVQAEAAATASGDEGINFTGRGLLKTSIDIDAAPFREKRSSMM